LPARSAIRDTQYAAITQAVITSVSTGAYDNACTASISHSISHRHLESPHSRFSPYRPRTRRGELQVTHTIPAARLSSASKTYDDKIALRDVSLDIGPGGVVALLGPNGAGKTTTVKLLLGLAAPTSGSVTLFGGDPRRASSRQRIGAMLQVGKVPETLRVSEHIDLFRTYYPNPMPTAEIFAAAGLDGLGDRKFGDLSGGQRQRVLFALAICGDPDMLFLDEPTLGFDVETRRSFWEQIRAFVSRGRTILLTTHYMEEADALADRIVVIDHGSIIAD